MRWRTEECIDSAIGQETQLAVLGMVVRVLYTVHVFQNVLHYDAIRKVLESYGREEKLAECIVQNLMETHRTYWKLRYRTGTRLG